MGDVRARLRAARRPRMLAMLGVVALVVVVFTQLGSWQLDRAISRGEERAAAAAAEVSEAAPVPLADVLAPQSPFSGTMTGRHVEVEGEWGSDVLLVAGRVHDGRTGFLVLAPLTVDVPGGPAVLPVVRGWVASADDLAGVGPASGSARVVGWLHVGEAAGDPRRELPAGQTDAVSPAELVNRWGGPTYTAYLVVDETTPAQSGVEPLGAPGRDPGGVDWRNLGYALQWWLFGLFGIALWWRMLGDEVRDRVEAQHATSVPEPAAGPTSASV